MKRPLITKTLTTIALTATLATASYAAECGGGFNSFVKGLRQEAQSMGYDAGLTKRFFANVAQDQKVLAADRRQGVFQKNFTKFSRHLISQNRINTGKKKAQQYSAVFDRIEREYGVSRGVLLAFWAFETDYGGYQGDFNTLNALVTPVS